VAVFSLSHSNNCYSSSINISLPLFTQDHDTLRLPAGTGNAVAKPILAWRLGGPGFPPEL